MVDNISTYPIWEPTTRANPQALYAQMREEDPVHLAIGPQTGNRIWFLTRYEDCVTILKHPQVGKELFKSLPPEVSARYGEPMSPDNPWHVINHHLLNIDPPDHTRLRNLVHKAFTPRMVENLRPRIQQIADDLLDGMAGTTHADLIDSFALPLPITVIAEMLGVPVEDRDRFRKWTQVILFSVDYGENMASLMEFTMYMHEMIEARQKTPREDILSALVTAEDNGETLNREELLSMIFLLLVAGHETTVNLIANGTLALMQHPDQFAKLKADPDNLMKTAVEEMLRYNGPVEVTTTRWAFEDIAIGGKVITQGDIVLVSLLGANRDPEIFTDPDVFDITRTPNRHIAFGHGIHFCVGAPLARMEGAIAMNSLVRRLPNLELDTNVDQLEWNTGLLLHGMNALPVRY